MLAHELRNPLAPISTAASVLNLPTLGQAHMVEVSRIIQRQVQHMSQLVDDLLDVSRVTRGTISLDRRVLDLREVVGAAVEQVQGLLDERSHTVELRLGERPVWVDVDRTRLVQVVSNLLNNAAKYTDPHGRIEVTVGAGADRAELVVADSGIGMAPELLPRVFELFAQAERSLDRSQGGLGIGLALVRSIVQLHGGSVRAESDGPGQGSRFTVELPLASPPRPGDLESDQAVEAAPALRRVVLVDDNVDAASTLSLFLQSLGHRVREFHSAEEALAGLSGGAPPVDVFVFDLGLPGMDGHELARRLRKDPRFATACFASLSGYGQRGVERTEDGVFDRNFLKPADLVELASWVAGAR
jgi:CheY-like chemotaxis protein